VIPHINDGIDNFLDEEKRPIIGIILQRPEAVPLYYTAVFGFHGLMRHFISRRPQGVNTSKDRLGTLLHAAVTPVSGRRVEDSWLLLIFGVPKTRLHQLKPRTVVAPRGSFEMVRVLVGPSIGVHLRADLIQFLLGGYAGVNAQHKDTIRISLLRFMLHHTKGGVRLYSPSMVQIQCMVQWRGTTGI
jgi:hypothetical protein